MSATKRTALLSLLLVGISLIEAAMLAVGSLRAVSDSWFRVPYFDMVLMAKRFEVQGYRWVYQAVDHVLISPMPFFILDDAWLGARGALLVGVNLACSMLLVLCFGWGVRGLVRRDWLVGLSVLALIAGSLWWFGHFMNWVWPVQIVVGLSLVGVALGFLFLVEADSRILGDASGGPMLPLVLWAGAALFATTSFGYGLLLFPCGLALALSGRWPWKHLVPVVLVSALGLGGFSLLYDSRRLSVHGLPRLLDHPLVFLEYLLSFVSAVPQRVFEGLGFQRNIPARPSWLAACLGAGTALVLIVILTHVVVNRWRRKPPEALETLGFLFGGFSLGVVVLVAVPRSALGSHQAMSHRYVTPQVLLLISLLLLLVSRRSGFGRLVRRVMPVLAPCLLLVLLMTQRTQRHTAYRYSSQINGVAMAALVGVAEPEHYSVLLPKYPQEVLSVMDRFRTQGKSVFGAAWSQGLGVALETSPASPGECVGEIGAPAPVALLGGATGAVTRGWAWDVESDRALRRMLWIDRESRIRGFGSTGGNRHDVADRFGATWIPSGFLLYADGTPDEGWRVLGERADGVLCSIVAPSRTR